MGKTGNERVKAADGWDAAYRRIQEALGVSTQMELAAALGVRQSSISDAKRRESIPADWQLALFEDHGLMPAWVRTGEGPMRVGEPGAIPMNKGRMQTVETLFRDFTKNASAAMGLGATG